MQTVQLYWHRRLISTWRSSKKGAVGARFLHVFVEVSNPKLPNERWVCLLTQPSIFFSLLVDIKHFHVNRMGVRHSNTTNSVAKKISHMGGIPSSWDSCAHVTLVETWIVVMMTLLSKSRKPKSTSLGVKMLCKFPYFDLFYMRTITCVVVEE